MIVFIGFEAMELLTRTDDVVMRADERRALLVRSEVDGVPAYGMPHLTGAIPKPSDEELRRIGEYLMGELGEV